MLKNPDNMKSCENVPCEAPRPLTNRAENIKERLSKVLQIAEGIYGTLYGPVPDDCCGNQKEIYSLEETLQETNYVVSQLESCLSETLERLRG